MEEQICRSFLKEDLRGNSEIIKKCLHQIEKRLYSHIYDYTSLDIAILYGLKNLTNTIFFSRFQTNKPLRLQYMRWVKLYLGQ